MAKPEPRIDDLRDRLDGLLADWAAEISAVMNELESQKTLAATRLEQIKALEEQVGELADFRKGVRDRDLALAHLRKKSREKDDRIAELERERDDALARVSQTGRKPAESKSPPRLQKGGQRAEFEAMRADLAARKALIKNLRVDADRVKSLEKELEENRDVISTMKESIDRHARTIAELRRSSDGWERKWRRLAEAGKAESTQAGDKFSDTAVALFLDETMAVEGDHTIVIDMTEPLREARHEIRKKR